MSSPSASFAGDLLARRPFCEKLESFLQIEHQFMEGALVVSLNASFGSGKTTVIKMWSDDLNQRRSEDATLPRIVVINSWETDFVADPLVALISGIADALKEGPDKQPSAASKIGTALADVGRLTYNVANQAAKNFSGIDVDEAVKGAISKRSTKKEGAEKQTILLEFEKKRNALRKLKEELKAAFHGDTVKAIVVIDELDRCRPDYAISYLETIKHIFDIHGLAFILAVDESQLGSAAQVLFGRGLVFSEYYRKFAHRTVDLPGPTKSEIQATVRHYTGKYLRADGKRWCVLNIDEHRANDIAFLISHFAHNQRQVQEIFRILGHLLSVDERSANQWYWARGTGSAFLCTLRVTKPLDYKIFSREEATPQELWKIVSHFGPKKAQQWFGFIVPGLRRSEEWLKGVRSVFTESRHMGLPEANSTDFHRLFASEISGWGDSNDSSLLQQIHKRIEALESFAR